MESISSHSGDELVVASLPAEPKKLICVEFPGIVENEEKGLACLGGNTAVSKAYYGKNEKLELRFRPEDQYCKPAVARTNKTSSLVLKVKRKRRAKSSEDQSDTREEDKKNSGPSSSEATLAGDCQGESKTVEYEYSAELLGVVNTVFQFPGMVDYQTLPPGLNTMLHNGGLVDPKDFQVNEPVDESFTDRDLPAFLPPQNFSRFDKPTNFVFTKGVKIGPKSEDGNRGPRRVANTYGLTFDFKGSIPTQPPHADVLTSQFASHPKLQQLKELYEERPVWSRLALQWRLKLPETVVRQLLAIVAYKFISGPFKKMWVKFGYDPRADPTNKIYQSLDIRVPQEITTVRRSRVYTARSKRSLLTPSAMNELIASKEQSSQTDSSTTLIEETMFMYYPDRLPTQRQLHYQLCDIMDDKLQEIIHSNDGREKECTEVNGWCEENTYDKLRKAMTVSFKQLAAAATEVNSDSTSVAQKQN